MKSAALKVAGPQADTAPHSPTPWVHATDIGQVGSVELPDGTVIAQTQALVGDERSRIRTANAAYLVKCVNGYEDLAAVAAKHRRARLATLGHAAELAAALRVLADIPLEDFGKENKPEYPLMGWNGHQLLVGHVLAARAALTAFNPPKRIQEIAVNHEGMSDLEVIAVQALQIDALEGRIHRAYNAFENITVADTLERAQDQAHAHIATLDATAAAAVQAAGPANEGVVQP